MSKFTKTITAYAEQLGWGSCQPLSDTCFRMAFDMGEGRSQNVIITHYPTEAENKSDLVEISSAVLKMDGFPDGKLGAGMAGNLLRENAQMGFAAWAIEETSDGPYLVAMSGWLLDDLDKEELELAVLIVSKVADTMEETLGVDNF